MPIVNEKKWIGRFIRKNDPILELVEVVPFNLKDISKHPTAVPDNATNSILHHRLHHPKEFNDAIHNSSLNTTDLTPEGGRRPVLVPLDFTKDWEDMKRRVSRKNSRFDEDEDDLEILEQLEAANHESSTKTAHPIEPKQEEGASEAMANQPPPLTENIEKEDLGFEKPPLSIRKQKEMLDDVSKSLPKDIKDPLEAVTQHDQAGFTPLVESHQSSNNEDQPPTEQIPSQQAEPPSPGISDQELQELEKKSYQAGFEKGMAKALDELKSQHNDSTRVMESMLGELSNLKKEVLHNAQDNFRAICESMMEAILGQEFKVNPESLGHVINRAINETVEQDDFKLLLHPQTAEQLTSILPENLRKNIAIDDNLGETDFRIESNQKVIDGKTTKIISDLLDQADLNLFSKNEAS